CLLSKNPAERYPNAYAALRALCQATDYPIPPQSTQVRESFLQASTFVGREAELNQLVGTLDQLNRGAALFLVGGESGVGKSRLLEELRIRALVRRVTVLRGQAVEEGAKPFQAWRGIVRPLLLMAQVSDMQASILKDLAPDVADLLGRPIPDAPELTGRAYQDRLVLTIVDLLRAVPHPVVLLLEDIHWGEDNLVPLRQIVQVRDQLPQLMIVATYRDDEAPALPDALPAVTHLTLERLDLTATRELGAAMLGDAGTRDEVVQLLHTQSEGNLFFLLETVRALAEQSPNLHTIGQTPLPSAVLTGRMQELTRRRLNKVDARFSDLQRLAAVIGREIKADLLASCYDAAAVEAWLANASDYGVVEVVENTWRFAHDKLRETILTDIPAGDKPALHRTAAQAIEAVFPGDDNYNEALLHHWRAAGDIAKELHYLNAVAHYMTQISNRFDAAEALLTDVLNRLPMSDPRRAAPLNLLAILCSKRGQYQQATRYAEEARIIAQRTGKPEDVARALQSLGIAATHQGDYERGTAIYQQCLVMFRELGMQRHLGLIFNNLGVIATYQGDYAQAAELFGQGVAIFRQIDDQRNLSMGLNNLGNIATFQGDYARAVDLHQQSLTIREQLGTLHGISNNLISLGIVAKTQKDYARAAELFERSLAIARRIGDQTVISYNLNNLGDVARNQGDYERASDLYQQSLAMKRERGDQLGMSYSLNGLGQVALKQRHVHDAVDCFTQALSITMAINTIPRALIAILGLAEVFMVQGQPHRAGELVGLARAHPKADNDVQEVLADLLLRLEAALPSAQVKAALEHGAQLNLDTVAADLITQFQQEGT
ncbi:MAG: tetratricopeptide repeat protein, partial [Anaerolineae bacterium]